MKTTHMLATLIAAALLGLVAMGVIKPRRKYRPNPFPGDGRPGFVPDPY